MYVCMHTCTYVCLYVYAYMYVYMYNVVYCHRHGRLDRILFSVLNIDSILGILGGCENPFGSFKQTFLALSLERTLY